MRAELVDASLVPFDRLRADGFCSGATIIHRLVQLGVASGGDCLRVWA